MGEEGKKDTHEERQQQNRSRNIRHPQRRELQIATLHAITFVWFVCLFFRQQITIPVIGKTITENKILTEAASVALLFFFPLSLSV